MNIAGLGGEPDYTQRFKMWADDIDGSLKKAGGETTVTTLNAPHLEQIRARFAELAKQAKPTDALVVMLIGHGTYDGHDYKFNITGPDITAAELATLLDHVPAQRQLVVNMTSCSGGSIEQLRRPNRIVISATKTGSEKNATNFARYFAEALREPAADTDKNESVSALEAFRYAQAKTTEFFDTQKRLATEHSVIEDTGKGGRAHRHCRKRRGQTGGILHRCPPGRQCRRRPRSQQASPAGQEGTARTGNRKVEIRKGRDAGPGVQAPADPTPP